MVQPKGISGKSLLGIAAVLAAMSAFIPMHPITRQEAGGVCQSELLRKFPALSDPEHYSISARLRYPRLTPAYQFDLVVTGKADGRSYGEALCEIGITNRAAPVNPRIVREDVARHLPTPP